MRSAHSTTDSHDGNVPCWAPAWLRGYPVSPPSTLIVVGLSREDAELTFTSCRLAGHNGNPYGVENEESRYHPDIFVCGGPRQPWPEFWPAYQHFG